MNLEQQIRQSVEGLELTLPAGMAQRAARGGRRRQYRNRAALSSVGLLSLSAGGYAVVRGSSDHAAVSYADNETSYVQNGVTFQVPKDLPLFTTNDRGMSFDDGDSVITVLVTRYENDPYFAPTPIMKDLGNRVLFRVSGTDDAVMQQIAATASDGYDGTRVLIDTLSVPVPDGFNVLEVTGPDTREDGGDEERRSTVHLCQRNGGPEIHCLRIILNRTRYAQDASVEARQDTIVQDSSGAWTGTGVRRASGRDITNVQVNGEGGAGQLLVDNELSGTQYA